MSEVFFFVKEWNNKAAFFREPIKPGPQGKVKLFLKCDSLKLQGFSNQEVLKLRQEKIVDAPAAVADHEFWLCRENSLGTDCTNESYNLGVAADGEPDTCFAVNLGIGLKVNIAQQVKRDPWDVSLRLRNDMDKQIKIWVEPESAVGAGNQEIVLDGNSSLPPIKLELPPEDEGDIILTITSPKMPAYRPGNKDLPRFQQPGGTDQGEIIIVP